MCVRACVHVYICVCVHIILYYILCANTRRPVHDCHATHNEHEKAQEHVEAENLADGEHVHGFVAPVAGLVQQLREARLPHSEHPVRAHAVPHEQEQGQHRVHHLVRPPGQGCIVVHVIERVRVFVFLVLNGLP